MKSRKLKKFIEEITYNNRNPKDNDVIKLLDDNKSNPILLSEVGEKYYRCRIIKDMDIINNSNPYWGFNDKDSFVPDYLHTYDMRANYRYIPYLYCSSFPYVSVCETRPRIGAKLNLATIEVNQQLTLFDLTKNRKISYSGTKNNLINDLSEMFSKPVCEEDDISDYIPTQYIAEYIKKLGYDGIAFNSSVIPEYFEPKGPFQMLSGNQTLNEKYKERYNAVIFNYEKCKVIHSNVLQISNIYYSYEQIDEDSGPAFSYDPMVELLNASTYHGEVE